MYKRRVLTSYEGGGSTADCYWLQLSRLTERRRGEVGTTDNRSEQAAVWFTPAQHQSHPLKLSLYLRCTDADTGPYY